MQEIKMKSSDEISPILRVRPESGGTTVAKKLEDEGVLEKVQDNRFIPILNGETVRDLSKPLAKSDDLVLVRPVQGG